MMNRREKYAKIIPSLYACYDRSGQIDPGVTRRLCRYLAENGAGGIYVCGSAGECVFLTPGERMLILECALAEVGGEIPVIVHVACPTTEDSRRLAAHAASAGADAIAALPPFFYKLSDGEIAEYWKGISASAPGVDFFIYDIPQLSANSLSEELLRTMCALPDLAGVKMSADDVGEVVRFCRILGEDRVVMGGSDGLLHSALSLGAVGGIGGTYAVMLERYNALHRADLKGDLCEAAKQQSLIWAVLEKAEERRCCIYALMKEILRQSCGIDAGGVRAPLGGVREGDPSLAKRCLELLR